MSAANVGEKNIFKLDEDEGDEVRYCVMRTEGMIRFLFIFFSVLIAAWDYFSQ